MRWPIGPPLLLKVADRFPPSPHSITLPIFFICYFGWKITKKTRWVSLDRMDFDSGRQELDEMDALENAKYESPGFFGKVGRILF